MFDSHGCSPSTLHVSFTFVPLVPTTEPSIMEVLNKYLWMKKNKYFIHSSIHLFTGETLVQLVLGCEDHLPITSVTPLMASLQLASVCVWEAAPSYLTAPPFCDLCCIPDNFSLRVKSEVILTVTNIIFFGFTPNPLLHIFSYLLA